MQKRTITGKKPKKFLTYAEQLEVIEVAKSGVPWNKICKDFEISKSFYNKLLNRKDHTLEKVKSLKNRKTSKTTENKVLEKALLKWFVQTRDRGDPITGVILREKALSFNDRLKLPTTFKASNGWLENFKKRHGVKFYALKGEKLSSNLKDVEEFSEFLKEKINRENLSLENIYNADESGIYWKDILSYALAKNTDKIEEEKEIGDRISVLFCSNASGKHRIPLLIIGESEVPNHLKSLITSNLKEERLKAVEMLGVIYTHQSNGWIDSNVFNLWYTEVFIPSVITNQKKFGISGKVLLILDNAPCHSVLVEVNSVHPNFEIVYLPPNLTTNIQPMEQGLISLTMKHYKKNLLRRMFFNDEGTLNYLKDLNLKKCIILLHEAWNTLKESTLNKVWKQILGSFCTSVLKNEEDIFDLVDQESVIFPNEFCDAICQALQEFERPVETSKALLLEWFNKHNTDCGWEPLSDDKIVDIIVDEEKKIADVSNNDKNSVDNSEYLGIFVLKVFKSPGFPVHSNLNRDVG